MCGVISSNVALCVRVVPKARGESTCRQNCCWDIVPAGATLSPLLGCQLGKWNTMIEDVLDHTKLLLLLTLVIQNTLRATEVGSPAKHRQPFEGIVTSEAAFEPAGSQCTC